MLGSAAMKYCFVETWQWRPIYSLHSQSVYPDFSRLLLIKERFPSGLWEGGKRRIALTQCFLLYLKTVIFFESLKNSILPKCSWQSPQPREGMNLCSLRCTQVFKKSSGGRQILKISLQYNLLLQMALFLSLLWLNKQRMDLQTVIVM